MASIGSMQDVRFLINKKHAICLIDDLSDNLKDKIRDKLSSVCYGISKARSNRRTYNYQNTLKEFLKRYDSKAPRTQIGMIGELLTHILIFYIFPEFQTISPYFNLEEKSIKKGFDVILFSLKDNIIWITEVKSGELHQKKTANETNRELLEAAKLDLKKRLNKNEVTFWENAINGANIALSNKVDIKDAVMEILNDISDNVSDDNAQSKDKNVILASSLFSSLSDEILKDEVSRISSSIENENIFNRVFTLSIQKETYSKVVKFLKQEVAS